VARATRASFGMRIPAAGADGHEAALVKAESLGGKRLMGPEQVMENLEIGLFCDPEGHVTGLIKATS
jgi:uncharacterized protein